jgi:hypothetical protein
MSSGYLEFNAPYSQGSIGWGLWEILGWAKYLLIKKDSGSVFKCSALPTASSHGPRVISIALTQNAKIVCCKLEMVSKIANFDLLVVVDNPPSVH